MSYHVIKLWSLNARATIAHILFVIIAFFCDDPPVLYRRTKHANMVFDILTFPPELLIFIFAFLEPQDLLSSQLTCSHFQKLITTSALLQYHSALRSLCLIDNPSPNCTLSISERLKLLKERERAWCNLEPTYTTDVKVDHNPSGIYDLAAGVYLLGDMSRQALYWCRLPGREDIEEGRPTSWEVVKVQRKVVDMAFALYEHDLMAVMTTHGRSPFEVEVSFFCLSTGLPHPLALRHQISILNTPHEKPSVGMEIVGRHLVLVMGWHNNASKPDNHLFVINWVKGDIKMHVTRPYGSYSSLVHLTEHIFVLPNALQFTLEFWRIPKKAGEPIPIAPEYILGLPRLNVGRIVGSISCRGEPNPVGDPYDPRDNPDDSSSEGSYAYTGGTFKYCSKPFIPDPMESIIIFNVRILPTLPPFFGLGFIGNTFTFFVHRRALLDLFLRRHGVGLELESLGSPSSTRANIDAMESDDESTETESRTPSPSGESTIHFPPLPPSPQIPPTPSHPPGPSPVPFEAWGPKITRWINSDVLPTRWITTTCGQRCVLIANQAVAQGGTREFPWVVLDFNPSRIRRQKKREAKRKRAWALPVEIREDDDVREERWTAEQTEAPARTWIVSQPEEINSVDAFSVRSQSDGIRTSLPYIATASSEQYNFEGVLMDEERILGINTDMLDRIHSVRVHYFG